MKHIALILAALMWADAALAQPAPVTLTVEDAIARAMEASHRVREVRAREQGAQAAIEVRRATARPTVTVTSGYTRTNRVEEFGVVQPNGQLRVIYPDIPDNYFTRAAFQWPIYTAGRADALERAAEAEARAVGAEIDIARAELRLEVTRAYWALVTANESVRVVQEALGRADAHLHDVQAMFDQGLVPPNEVLLVDAQRSRQQMQLIEAQNLQQSVAGELRHLTGVPRDVGIVVAGPPSLVSSSAASLDEASERAERRVLLERISVAEERGRAAVAGRKPTVALTGTVDYANPNPRIFPRRDQWRESWDIGVNVAWPLWDAGRSKAEAAEAAAAATAARERLADVDSLIALDVRQRQLDIDSAKAAIAAAEDAVRSAQEARRVVAERFRVGVATSTDVLDAQVTLLQADLDRTRGLANLKLAEARLDRALGR
jgi:outer membrane protein